MATTEQTFETRRGFLSGLFALAGGVTAAALGSAGCAVPASPGEPVGAAGATEVLPLSPGLRYANVMPDRLPAVRAIPSPPAVEDWSARKR